MTTEQHGDLAPIEVGGGASRTAGVVPRPGILTFAAVLMFMVASFEALSAVLAFAGTGWWVTASGDLVYANFVFWGIVDSFIALIALYAGVDILRGGAFGLTMGYVFAGIGAIRWLFVIPAAPVLSVVVIALCVLVLYGLTKHSDYGEEA